LEKEQQDHHFPPGRVFNVDEMGLSAVQITAVKAVPRKGNMNIVSMTSAGREIEQLSLQQ
jgi:hypothetical protein